MAIGEGRGGQAAAVPGELDDVVEQVDANVHQAVAAVVALVAGVNVAQLADAPLGVGPRHGTHGAADAPLVVDGDANALRFGLGEHLVGLGEVGTHRFFDLDVDAVLEYAHRQRVVELGAGGNGHQVRLRLADHLVEVGEPRRDA